METSFGFREVGEGDKQPLVDDVFHRVAGRYDLMNDLMSGGMHRLWKDALVAWLNPPKRGAWKVLDVAGGTGDIAFRIVEASGGNAHATVLDINGSMLEVGRERAGEARSSTAIPNSSRPMPRSCLSPTRSFDAYTIAFGIRNVPRIEAALARGLPRAEARRPLPLPRILRGRRAAARPRLRGMVVQRHPAHRPDRRRRRPSPMPIWSNRSASSRTSRTSRAMVSAAGFERVTWRNYSGGIAALHSGWKL